MPKRPLSSKKNHELPPWAQVYVGIDPGANGGIAAIRDYGSGEPLSVAAWKMPPTERDLWNLLSKLPPGQQYAVIEGQSPRPTAVFDRRLNSWRNTILKSTCLLWGNYCQLRAMLIAAGIRFEEAVPRTWQTALKISPKKKDEAPGKWKNRLKAKAQQLFPDVTVTLATADALLLAEYCRRLNLRKQ